MQIRGQTQVLQSRVGYPNLIASQTGCFITHQLLDFKRSLPLKGKHSVFRTENISCKFRMTLMWPQRSKSKICCSQNELQSTLCSEHWENVRWSDIHENKISRWSNGSLSMGFMVLSNFCIDLLIQKQYLRFVKHCQNKESSQSLYV